jgi:symplekin
MSSRTLLRGELRFFPLVQGCSDSRSKFASIWLNEEWYNEKISHSTAKQYTSNLEAILTTYLPKIDGRDKSLAAFLTSLPEIPVFITAMLEGLCVDPDRSIVGFLALRDLVETRPPVRQAALNVLLELCTHDDRKIRVLAISTDDGYPARRCRTKSSTTLKLS